MYQKSEYDVRLIDPHGRIVITEVKGNLASESTLRQLKCCMKSAQKTEKKPVRGMIVCKESSDKLNSLARKEQHIEVLTMEQ